MTNTTLAQSYLAKARARLKALEVLLGEAAYSDVVREAQETVELALKGMLRQIGIEPPKWHDVGEFLQQYRERLSPNVVTQLDRLTAISTRLRKERELAFYGDVDFIPTERYDHSDAARALEDARFVVTTAAQFIASR